MSWKAFFLLIIIIVGGIFIYLKLQVNGNPNSNFNQGTRYALGQHPLLRTALGLHSVGDARYEYLAGSGPIAIEWFEPESEVEGVINNDLLNTFASDVAKYTGRQTEVVNGGAIDDGTVPLDNFNSFMLKAYGQRPAGSSVLTLFFPQDYSPRAANELSTTYQESGIVVSLNAQRNFLLNYPGSLGSYILASMLREFGSQIGLPETSSTPDCIMNLHPGINGQPLEYYGQREPTDFCAAEVNEINNLKLQY